MRLYLCALVCAVFIPLALADTIAHKDATYEGVYVTESPERYFVGFPEDGRALSLKKDEVTHVQLSDDPGYRQSLYDLWSANNSARKVQQQIYRQVTPANVRLPEPGQQPQRAGARPEEPQARSVGAPLVLPVPRPEALENKDGYVTDGMVDSINLQDVPLKDGLRAMLRPLNLDYKVEEGHIWISTPERIRTESTERLETRVYEPKSTAYETLPEIILANPGGSYQANQGNGFGGGRGGGGQNAGFGGSGFGGGASGFGGAGGRR